MGITLTQTQLIPTNVVEVGNELSQNVLNGLAASGISGTNPAATMELVNLKILKPIEGANYSYFDYGQFKQTYSKEILISTPSGQFYIPSR